MNKTKIIATIGPASQDYDVLKELVKSGMDVIRINLGHADLPFCDRIIDFLKQINEELNTNVAVMLDLTGPTVRMGFFQGGKATFKVDDIVMIYDKDIMGNSKKFSTNYDGIVKDVKCHTILKLNDGKVTLKVVEKEEHALICKVIDGGTVYDHQSLNVPGVSLNIPFLGKRDREVIRYAHQKQLDFLALSFVRSSEDVLEVNDILIELGNDHIGLVSKIENEQALDDIDEIIKVSDAVMVARGDLGVELPFERIPGIQKSILHKCHIAGVVSIVATEILSSMEKGSRPTRAEVSDLANAVLDGVDAVMLSGETTIGSFPIETMEMMEKIIASSEENMNYNDFLERSMRTEKQDITGNIAYSVVDCANRLKCEVIVAPTVTGYTAKKISRFRPICPVLALSPDINVVKSLALHFGVQGIYVKKLDSIDKMIHAAKECAKNELNIKEGTYILTGGYPFSETQHTNFLRIEEL